MEESKNPSWKDAMGQNQGNKEWGKEKKSEQKYRNWGREKIVTPCNILWEPKLHSVEAEAVAISNLRLSPLGSYW